MKTYYIGADVHKQSTTIAVRQNNKIITMTTIPTQIDKLIEFLEQFRGRKYLTIEESSLAAWLHCHLHDKVDKLISCDPRRNRTLKNVVIGAARSIIDKGDNLFQRDYERMVANGMSHSNALHALARKVLTLMWGMWKHQRSFDPHLWQVSNGLC